ncbi:MAG: hypothetical protein HOO96_23890 [Polyangiaceae bacterium]|nr:hypothetical protein [Polyangiaceae bacterium]
MSRISLALFAALTLLAPVAAGGPAPLTRTKVTTTGAVPRAPRAASDTPEITVIARIRDLGMVAPACGHFASIGIHRYEVLAVLSGHYDHRDLFVAMPCPGTLQAGAGPGAAYRVGAVFQIDVARPAHRIEGAIYDAFSADKSPRYLLQATPIPRGDVVP